MSSNVDKMEKQRKYPPQTMLFILNFIVKLPSAGTEGRCYLNSCYLPTYPRQYEAPIPISSPPPFNHSYFTLSKHRWRRKA